jgi:WD40 repeat protein
MPSAPAASDGHSDVVVPGEPSEEVARSTTQLSSQSIFSDAEPHPKSQTMQGFKQQVRGVAYAPDGNSFAMADTNSHRVRIYRYVEKTSSDEAKRTNTEAEAYQTAHDAVLECEWALSGRCFGLAYSPDGALLATADYENNNAAIWDVATARRSKQPEPKAVTGAGHTQGVHTVAFSPDSRHVATGSWDSTVRVWESHTGQPVRRQDNEEAVRRRKTTTPAQNDEDAEQIVLKGHDMRVVSVAYAPPPRRVGQDLNLNTMDQRIIATASCDGTVKTWEAETGDLLYTYRAHTDNPHKDEFPTVVFSPDGSSFATNGDKGAVLVYSMPEERADKAELCLRLGNRDMPLNLNSASHSNRKAYNLMVDKKDGGTDIQHLRVSSIAYSADWCLLACGHADSNIRLWDLALGEVVQVLCGHEKGEVWSMAFDPSSPWNRAQGLLTGGADGTARVWNTFFYGACAGECTRQVTADGSEKLNIVPAHDKDVTKVQYAPDGRTFLSVGFDNSVRVWENIATSAGESGWHGAQVKQEIKTSGPVTAADWKHEDQFAAGFVLRTVVP